MYASLCFLFFGASRVYFLYASGCLLASLYLIQFFCVYLSKKKKKKLGHPVYATYLILGMSIWQKLMDFLLTLNRLKLMIGSAIVVYLLFMFLIFTIDLEILCNAYGSLLPFPSFSFFIFGFIIS